MQSLETLLARVLLILAATQIPAAAQGWVDVSSPSNNPGGRYWAGMCFDESRNYVLLSFGDTWIYNGSTWTSLSPPTQPARPGGNNFKESNLVCDPLNNKILAINSGWYNPPGALSYIYVSYFSEWDGQNWTAVGSESSTNYSSLSPWAENWKQTNSAAYDASRNEIVRFCSVQGGTFIRSTGGWQQRTPLVSPNVTLGSAFQMFYDASRQRVALVVQNPPGYWEWNGATGNWSQIFPSYLGNPITNGSFGPIAWHATRNIGIGLGVEPPNTTTTLQYGGSEISRRFPPTQPAVRYRYSIAFDSLRNKIVLVGGSGYADTWELDLGIQPNYTLTGTGCQGSRGTPTLTMAGGPPFGGQTFYVQVSGMAWNQPSFMFLGLSNSSYAGVPLPYDLASLGAPGCLLRASGDFLYSFPNVLGVGVWQYSVPNAPGLVLYNQAISFDPTANTLGLTVSNVGTITIGN